MIKKIIEFSSENKFFIIMAVLVLVLYAIHTMKNIKLDAIPDLSDTQVIVYTKWDRSPDIIEDQVTYPIVTALLGAPKVKAIRGFSDFGFSYVYIIFEDGTDIYWARSRVIEYLSKVKGTFQEGVQFELGPDATGVGWVFQYVLIDKNGNLDLSQLRSYQDWYLKYALQSVPGVAEVASIGGFQKQYQITVDPNLLQNFNISITEIMEAVKKSNNEVGGRLIEWSGKEFMVRAKGYIKSPSDIEKIVIKTNEKGIPVYLKDVAQVGIGPQIRRGILDYNGVGDSVGGIVVMRHGENALNVIKRIKQKIEELKPSLPQGVEIVTAYDRSELIQKSIDHLKNELLIEMAIVSFVILLFLWHIPSAIVPIFTIPISVTLAFIPMYFMGITSNIMSLSGIAISIGVLVDGAIVEVENAYKKLEIWESEGRKGDFHKVRLDALLEVGPSVFFSLAVIAVSFFPIFTLVEQEGRLFKPLAYTKTLAMILATILSITLDPALRMLFVRMDPFNIKPKFLSKVLDTILIGKYYKEENHPISKILFYIYLKPCRFVLKHPIITILSAILIVLVTIYPYSKLGEEFMPPLNEGTILYMPTVVPGISVTQAYDLLLTQDRILKSFPEVLTVFGKAGRADTSTDPAPLSMIETTVVLKPQKEWRGKKRWYSSFTPEFIKSILRHIWYDRITYEELINEMDKALQIPGNTNAWTMPIKGRIDMLTTGVRTPIGIKILGSDLKVIEEIGHKIEKILKSIDGTRSIFTERTTGGYYIDFIPDREALAKYSLTIEDIQAVIKNSIGGENIATTIEGRERYSINLRYQRDLRNNLDQLKKVLITTKDGIQIPIEMLAEIKVIDGPSMIRNENGLIAGYVFVDIKGRDIGSYVEDAKRTITKNLDLPLGYSLIYSGQYENMLRVRERLKIVLPLTIFLIFLLLYFNTKSYFKTFLVLLAVPFSLVGAVWFLFLLNYNISIAVWVGMIALMGLDAETGVFMLLFLDLSYEEAKRKNKLQNISQLKEAIINGAVKRIRPKMMTVFAAAMGLTPILWSLGTGSDMMKRVAAPMVGGLFTSFILELFVYPSIYFLWKKKEIK